MNPIKSKGDEQLETLLNIATNPQNVSEDWQQIMNFCEQVNNELEGPQIAVKLLAHKIQSPQQRESLHALSVLEACVKNCGERFHREIGKFRFLNEMIKVISPRYMGQTTSEAVKKRCIELLYLWNKSLSSESKIVEAYSMLKRQGLVKNDPSYLDSKIFTPPDSKSQPRSIFDTNEKSKELSRLLKSRNPQDLQAANRLIKNIVEEDNERIEKLSKRMTELETVRNNAKLLEEMLIHYRPGETGTADLEIMKEIVQNLEQSRPSLFRLARDADEQDQDGINDIIRVSDSANDVIKRYRDNVIQSDLLAESSPAPAQPSGPGVGGPATDDLLAFGAVNSQNGGGDDLLSKDLDMLGLNDIAGASAMSSSNVGQGRPHSSSLQDTDLLSDVFSGPPPEQSQVTLPVQSTSSTTPNLLWSTPTTSTAPVLPSYSSIFSQLGQTGGTNELSTSGTGGQRATAGGQPSTAGGQRSTAGGQPSTAGGQRSTASLPASKAFDDLNILGKQFVQQGKETKKPESVSQVSMDESLLDVTPQNPSTIDDSLIDIAGPSSLPTASKSPIVEPATPLVNLSEINVALSSIRPHPQHGPLSLVDDGNQVKVKLHFTADRPMTNVHAIVAVVTSENTSPLSDIDFRVAVPKSIQCRLQSASNTSLPGYSPFLPPSAINQILLVHNPVQEPIRLKYEFTYKLNGTEVKTSGETDKIPQ